jgi:hypothetical protein
MARANLWLPPLCRFFSLQNHAIMLAIFGSPSSGMALVVSTRQRTDRDLVVS